jgi:hypothetical protein
MDLRLVVGRPVVVAGRHEGPVSPTVSLPGKMRETRKYHNFVGNQDWLETVPEGGLLGLLMLRLEHRFH